MSIDRADPDFGEGLRHIGLVVDLQRLSAIDDVDSMRPLLHPEMRTLAAPGVAPSRPYETREDFLGYFADARANGVLVEPDTHEIRLTPSGAIIASGHLRMTAAGESDVTPAWFVYTFRDRRIASLETYLDRPMAYDAAGLA
jgi:ketosteroid isomerase-like protein